MYYMAICHFSIADCGYEQVFSIATPFLDMNKTNVSTSTRPIRCLDLFPDIHTTIRTAVIQQGFTEQDLKVRKKRKEKTLQLKSLVGLGDIWETSLDFKLIKYQ